MLIALGQLQLFKVLSNSRAIKQIWVKSRAERVKAGMISAATA